MKWKNFDRLVKHLKALNPSEFHYVVPFMTRLDGSDVKCGCVAAHISQRLDVWYRRIFWTGGVDAIVRFLGVSRQEAFYIWGESDHQIDREPVFALRLSGVDGIREALRRLDVVAERHGQVTARAFVADEPAFIASVRNVARHPAAFATIAD